MTTLLQETLLVYHEQKLKNLPNQTNLKQTERTTHRKGIACFRIEKLKLKSPVKLKSLP